MAPHGQALTLCTNSTVYRWGLRRRCDAALKPTALSMAQYAVLRTLADHPEASAAELARLCFVTRQSLQDVLGGLRAAGLVGSSEAPLRGRARSLRLTRQGKRRLDAGDTAIASVETAILQGIPVGSRGELVAWLTRCAENLQAAASWGD
jgi:DNA-binding MarR family transcriptional regulator